MDRRAALAALWATAAAAGCGGGGGSTPTAVQPAATAAPSLASPPTPPAPPPPPPPPPTPPPACGPAAAGNWTPATIRAAIRDRAAAAGSEYQLMAAPPTITPGVAHAASQIAGSVLIPWTDPRFFYTGDMQQAGTTWPNTMFGANRSVGHTPTQRESKMLSIEFTTDAPVFEVWIRGMGTPSDMRFIVDGQLAQVAPVSYGSGLFLTKVDFGTRQDRKIRLDAAAPFFGGVRIGPADSLCASYAPPRLRTMFIGDSFASGPSGAIEFAAFPYYAAQRLGWDDNWISAIGSTGYIAGLAPLQNFLQRYETDIRAYAPNVLVFAGGINDATPTDAQIEAQARTLFDRIQADLPNTVVFVMGPWNPRSTTRPGINAAIKAAAAGRPNFHWITNYDEPWITGTGYVGRERFDGNSDWVIGWDSVHPSPAGIHFLAQKTADAIEAWAQ